MICPIELVLYERDYIAIWIWESTKWHKLTLSHVSVYSDESLWSKIPDSISSEVLLCPLTLFRSRLGLNTGVSPIEQPLLYVDVVMFYTVVDLLESTSLVSTAPTATPTSSLIETGESVIYFVFGDFLYIHGIDTHVWMQNLY